MKYRAYWVQRIEEAWQTRSVIWLSGVRRVGKTVLCQSLADVEYFDCELPSTRRQFEDPESFLESMTGCRLVLDEIHRLSQPSQLLKIAADHFPQVKIIATGSSTLGASAKFSDTLAGRKASIWLTPMALDDLSAFGEPDLGRRLRQGGLPPYYLADPFRERDIQEWIDAYWAKDILELFRLERKSSFQRFVELVMASSGGIFEATRFAGPCEVSRTTIANYLAVLEATLVAHVVRPFNTYRPAEIISAPKVYGFDTGFVCTYRGWQEPRPEEVGLLWEHFVLNELHASLQASSVQYWRDKQGHEIDFVLASPGLPPVAIECKRSAEEFDSSSLHSFRRAYPQGENYVVAMNARSSYTRRTRECMVTFLGLRQLIDLVVPGKPAEANNI